MAPASMVTTANSHTMMVRQHRSSESSLPPAVSHRQVGHILQHNGKKAKRWGRLQLAIGHDKFGLNRQNNSSKAEHVNSLQTAVDRLSNGILPLDSQLQPLRSKKSCLRVQSKADLSAGEWRNQLKTIDAETHALTSWVSRSIDGKYYFIHSNLANNKELLSRLAPLRKLQLKVDRVSHESTKDQQSPERPNKPHCAAILSGRECTCKPRCY